jgi:hypothetical protein
LGDKKNAQRVLMGKSDGKITLERPKRRWEDNIEMDLREILWGGMDWIHGPMEGSSEYGSEPSGRIATNVYATDTLSCLINDTVRYTQIVPTDICFQSYLPSY